MATEGVSRASNRHLVEVLEEGAFVDRRPPPAPPLTYGRFLEAITEQKPDGRGRRRFLEAISDDAPALSSAERLKRSIREILSSDRRRSIQLERIADVLDAAKPPADQDSQAAELFDRLVDSLWEVIGDEDGDEVDQVQRVGDLVGRSDEARRFAESIREPAAGTGRRLVGSPRSSGFAASIRD